MAFRGPLLGWLENQIKALASGSLHLSVDVQDLGALKVGTELRFQIENWDCSIILRLGEEVIQPTAEHGRAALGVRKDVGRRPYTLQ
jgi:hypothetical protein